MTLANVLSSKFGLHPPEKLTRTSAMTPQRLKVIAILVLTAVFRFITITISNLYSIPAYLLLMAVLRPLRRHAHELHWYIEGVLFNWLQELVACWMWSGGYTVQECGEDISEVVDEEAIILVNHQSTADVSVIMYAFQTRRRVLNKILWIMDVLFKMSNFGAVSQVHGDFFIQQGKETRHLQSAFLKKHLTDTYIPRKREWIVLFPEGNFFWKQKKSSQAYGKKNGLPHLEHCLLPRAGAVQTIIETLNQEKSCKPVKWIVDITLAYPNGRPLNFQTIIAGQRDPMVTTLHYRKYPISEIPQDADGMRDWMVQVYSEKDKLLEAFYKTGQFPVTKPDDMSYTREPKKLNLSVEKVVFVNVFFMLLTCFELYVISSGFQMIYYLLTSMF